MPRRTKPAQPRKRSTREPERKGSSRRPRVSAPEVDAKALTLREGGASFSAIARTLELPRAADAHRCFVRALNTHDGDERRRLVASEEDRLNRLEMRIRHRDGADIEKVARRLKGVVNLREAIVR